MSFSYTEYDKSESKDIERFDTRYQMLCRTVANTLALLVNGKAFRETSDPIGLMGRLQLLPHQIIERAFPRISIASLYRRYRQVHLIALQEALQIVGGAKDKEDAYEKLLVRLRMVAASHVASTKNYQEIQQSKQLRSIQDAAKSAEVDFNKHAYGA